MKVWAGAVTIVSLLLWTLATLRGFDPGDAAGAVQRTATRQMALVAAVVALAGLLPLGRLGWAAVGLSGVLLLVALGFWLGLVPAG